MVKFDAGSVSGAGGSTPVQRTTPVGQSEETEGAGTVPMADGGGEVGDVVSHDQTVADAEAARAAAERAQNQYAGAAHKRIQSTLYQTEREMESILKQDRMTRADDQRLKELTIKARKTIVANLRYDKLDTNQQKLYTMAKAAIERGYSPANLAEYQNLTDVEKSQLSAIVQAANANFASHSRTQDATLSYLVSKATDSFGYKDMSDDERKVLSAVDQEVLYYIIKTDGNANPDRIDLYYNDMTQQAKLKLEGAHRQFEEQTLLARYNQDPFGLPSAGRVKAVQRARNQRSQAARDNAIALTGFDPATGKWEIDKKPY